MNKSLVALAISSSFLAIPALAEEAIAPVINGPEIILVTGKKSEQTLDEVAGSIAVATLEKLERHLVTDMNQLFKYDPSINITGGSGEAQNFVVRGMGGDRILMIKDGMRMNEGYGANGSNDIDPLGDSPPRDVLDWLSRNTDPSKIEAFVEAVPVSGG